MKEKKYDIYFENSGKVKSLNDDYFKCYQEIEKTLFKKQKNVLKTKVFPPPRHYKNSPKND